MHRRSLVACQSVGPVAAGFTSDDDELVRIRVSVLG
jgi:hypothetical protein